MKTIEEKNRMIAEFMGGKDQSRLIGGANEILFESPSYGGSKTSKIYTPFANLKYHTSWDWLMPVVEKVRTTDLKGTIMENIYSTYVVFPLTYSTEIYRVYDRVVEFIEWYNENK